MPQEGTGCHTFKPEQYKQEQSDSKRGGLEVAGMGDIAEPALMCSEDGSESFCTCRISNASAMR